MMILAEIRKVIAKIIAKISSLPMRAISAVAELLVPNIELLI